MVPRQRFADMKELDELEIEKVVLKPGDHAIGRSLRDLHVRHATGASIVAVRRGGKLSDSPDAAVALEEADAVYLVGAPDSVRRAYQLLARGALADVAS
jgi:K+/H+ antiporter YhaU regulatory subunit KhtT